ncbi:hypothetical protein BV898_10057 [Hypsibius exemplaris]|uniref:Uncharacterized protein n=1 Tax=Hypsibius exemplaris TaxID=2072580 RepID=A0A1W0WKR7_HYPEX|nr:hypothetical protein BV898_10057 [Hypsibius exemplaris]
MNCRSCSALTRQPHNNFITTSDLLAVRTTAPADATEQTTNKGERFEAAGKKELDSGSHEERGEKWMMDVDDNGQDQTESHNRTPSSASGGSAGITQLQPMEDGESENGAANDVSKKTVSGKGQVSCLSMQIKQKAKIKVLTAELRIGQEKFFKKVIPKVKWSYLEADRSDDNNHVRIGKSAMLVERDLAQSVVDDSESAKKYAKALMWKVIITPDDLCKVAAVKCRGMGFVKLFGKENINHVYRHIVKIRERKLESADKGSWAKKLRKPDYYSGVWRKAFLRRMLTAQKVFL